MARFEYTAAEDFDGKLDKLSREGLKQIVLAGAEACGQGMQAVIGKYHHIRTGSMQASVKPGKIHEDLDSCWTEVYPQGPDSRGVDNAMKAFVINYGYGKRRTQKTGDKFITSNKKQFKASVGRAMQAANDKLIADNFN